MTAKQITQAYYRLLAKAVVIVRRGQFSSFGAVPDYKGSSLVIRGRHAILSWRETDSHEGGSYEVDATFPAAWLDMDDKALKKALAERMTFLQETQKKRDAEYWASLEAAELAQFERLKQKFGAEAMAR